MRCEQLTAAEENWGGCGEMMEELRRNATVFDTEINLSKRGDVKMEEQKEKSKFLLYIAMFVFPMFAIPWIWFVRKDLKQSTKKKLIIISAIWLVILLIPKGDTTTRSETQPTQQTSQQNKTEPQSSRQSSSTAAIQPVEQQKNGTLVANDEGTRVKNKVKEYVDANYHDTTIDSVTVNPNLGTEKEGDYIALVRLTWHTKNSGKTSKEMLDMYSSDMAARMYKDLPEVQELAVFWTVPYLNGSAKISFERANGGMKYTDKIFDKNFNK